MKKALTIALTLALTLTACGGGNTPDAGQEPTPVPTEGFTPTSQTLSVEAGRTGTVKFNQGNRVSYVYFEIEKSALPPVINYDNTNTTITVDAKEAAFGNFVLKYSYVEDGIKKEGGSVTINVVMPTGKSKAQWMPTEASAAGQASAINTISWLKEPISKHEADVLRLVNEVRQNGTINGAPALAGSCVDGTFTAGTLPMLTYNAAAGIAAQRHATYMSKAGYTGHDELYTQDPSFYGATMFNRFSRAQQETGLNRQDKFIGENAAGGQDSAEQAMKDWIMSPPHCANLFDSRWTSVGAGHASATPVASGPYGPMITDNTWVQVFSIDSGVDLIR